MRAATSHKPTYINTYRQHIHDLEASTSVCLHAAAAAADFGPRG